MSGAAEPIPELAALLAPHHVVRIPQETDVPLTDRVRRLLDTPAMRRLGRVSQLGLVSLVYPGATHSRLEHSLGVYLNALRFTQRLVSATGRPAAWGGRVAFAPEEVESFLVAALVHDVGHWPYCHPIEDMRLGDVPRHEQRARALLEEGELAAHLERDWSADVGGVLRLLEGRPLSEGEQVFASFLSGPIDVDKLDYLQRDSLHAGVPYGRNFDAGRLIASLCLHPDRPRVAITDKGRTAAEMMVFARYVMFSEVYWHHAVRSATAMLQRAVWMLRSRFALEASCAGDDAEWTAGLRGAAEGSPAAPLVEGLFGARRRLYKRAAEFNVLDAPQLHGQLARRPYPWLVACSEVLARRLAAHTRRPLGVADVVIDAPPVKLEVDIAVDVVPAGGGPPRPLGQASPVVRALAQQQFDDIVKRVRVFVPEEVRRALPGGRIALEEIERAVAETGAGA